MSFQFKMPDIGEGIHEGEIVNGLLNQAIKFKKMTYYAKFKMIKQL